MAFVSNYTFIVFQQPLWTHIIRYKSIERCNITAALLWCTFFKSVYRYKGKLHLTPFTFSVIDFAEHTSYTALCTWIKDVRHHLILFKLEFPEALIPSFLPRLECRSTQSSNWNLCDWLIFISIYIQQPWIITEPGWRRAGTNKNYSPHKMSFKLWLYVALFLIIGNQRKCQGKEANSLIRSVT